MFKAFRRIFSSVDNKPVMLSFVLQRDECSRLLGEFGEKHLSECQSLVIVWENQEGDIMAVSSQSLPDSQASGMLLMMANTVGADNGK